jgi:predicted nucleotidyltransferase
VTEDHKRQITEFVEKNRTDENVVAIILIGSLARGDEREGSDLDVNLIVRTKKEESDITKDDLLFAATNANELTRWSYTRAKVLYSLDDEIAEIIKLIPVYQEKDRQYKMESFVSQMRMHLSYLKLAEYSKNTYLLHETAVKIALFAGRLVLADNRVLYPNRKWYSREIQRIQDKPENFFADMCALLEGPTIAKARSFIDTLLAYKAYPEPEEGWVKRFNTDSVFHWRCGTFTIEDW